MSNLTMRMESRRVIVTGAASGIGRQTAELLVEAGAMVTACDIQDMDPHTPYGPLRTVIADLSQEEDVMSVVQAASEGFPLDALVHCAGILDRGDLNSDLDNWNRVINVNLSSCFLLLKYVVPLLTDQGGSVVLIGSISGINGGVVAGPAYAASKAGVHGLTKWAAKRYAKDGVRVNAIAPGTIETPMGAMAGDAPSLTPLGHVGEPLDIARAALYLASSAGAFVTGAVWVVDGGLTI